MSQNWIEINIKTTIFLPNVHWLNPHLTNIASNTLHLSLKLYIKLRCQIPGKQKSVNVPFNTSFHCSKCAIFCFLFSSSVIGPPSVLKICSSLASRWWSPCCVAEGAVLPSSFSHSSSGHRPVGRVDCAGLKTNKKTVTKWTQLQSGLADMDETGPKMGTKQAGV